MNLLDTKPYCPLADEQWLLQKTAEGDREAFTRLYTHYYSGLYRFILFIIGSPEDSEEIIQDLFLKIWEKRAILIGIRSFDHYLFRMAKNRLFDTVRKSKARTKLIYRLGSQTREETDATREHLQLKEYHVIAQQAIDLLPDRRKRIFLLNAQEDMTAQAIAEMLGMSRVAVKKQLYEAIHFIKDHLHRNAGLLPLLLYFLPLFC